jgi:hypothetical protein
LTELDLELAASFKKCSKCCLPRPPKAFSVGQNYCKVCAHLYFVEWKARNLEKYNNYFKKYRKTSRHRCKRISEWCKTDIVKLINNYLRDEKTVAQLAEEYSCSKTTIYKIIRENLY